LVAESKPGSASLVADAPEFPMAAPDGTFALVGESKPGSASLTMSLDAQRKQVEQRVNDGPLPQWQPPPDDRRRTGIYFDLPPSAERVGASKTVETVAACSAPVTDFIDVLWTDGYPIVCVRNDSAELAVEPTIMMHAVSVLQREYASYKDVIEDKCGRREIYELPGSLPTLPARKGFWMQIQTCHFGVAAFASNKKRYRRALALATAVAVETFRSVITHGESRVREQSDAFESCVRIVQDAFRSHVLRVAHLDDAPRIVIEEF